MATVSELTQRNEEIRSELKDIEAENSGSPFDEDTKKRWNDLNVEIEDNKRVIGELEARRARLEELSGDVTRTEGEEKFSFQTKRPSAVPDDPTALEEYRNRAANMDDLEQAYRDGAKRIVEERYRHSLVTMMKGVDHEDTQGDAERMIDLDREVALRFIYTSSKKYQREFKDYCRTGIAGQEMMRAASLTTTAGGFAVPVELDTTLLLTNAGVINPIRQLARVRQTNVNTVEFLNTTGITAGFNAEATEASDNAPTLAQPTVNIEKAFAFVPASIEIVEDWQGFQADMSMAFADAKDRLESTKFLKGLGHTSHEPQGLIAAGGATAVVTTAATATFAVGDLMNLEIGLSARYRKSATCAIVGSKATFQKVRQFASNGVNIWVQLQGPQPPELIGYPAYEWSDYDATPTTSGSTILTIGDFNYFAIVDRVGMNVEFIPHLFGGSNRFPTGQRGLYAYWRTSSQVLAPTLQANSAFVSLKVL